MNKISLLLLAFIAISCSPEPELSVQDALFTVTYDYEPYPTLEAMAAETDLVVLANYTEAFENTDPNFVRLRFESDALREPFDLDWHRPEDNSVDAIDAALRTTTGFVFFLVGNGDYDLVSPQGFIIGMPDGTARPYANDLVAPGDTLASWVVPVGLHVGETAADVALAAELSGTWVLADIDGTNVETLLSDAGAEPATRLTLTVKADNLGFFDGCNDAGTPHWAVVDRQFRTGPVEGHAQLCEGINTDGGVGRRYVDELLSGDIRFDGTTLEVGALTFLER